MSVVEEDWKSGTVSSLVTGRPFQSRHQSRQMKVACTSARSLLELQRWQRDMAIESM